MTDRHYPTLDEKSILRVARLQEADASYLSDPRCTYSQEIKDIFTGKAQYQDFDNMEEVISDPTKLEEEIAVLYREIKQYGVEAKGSEKSSDTNTYFRLSVTLLEKLTTIAERASTINQHDQFVSTVMGIMEEILDADQRLVFQERMAKFKGETK